MNAFLYRAARLARSIKVITETAVLNVRNNSSIMDKTERFTGVNSTHDGIFVDSAKEPCSVDQVANRLQTSLAEWTSKNRKTIWFLVNRSDASWIPHLVKEGFYFHHAKKEYVVLYRSLTSDKNILPYAHTNIGIGAFVINEKTNEVLVIREKHSKQKPGQAMWKLPGGYVEPGETLPEAVEREVREETGITAKFKALVGFRHAHGYEFKCSDIYFVARLVPETFEINACPHEISECIWMKIEDYAKDPNVHKLNRFIAKKMIEYLEKHVEIGLIHGQRPNSTDPIWIYVIVNETEENPTIIN